MVAQRILGQAFGSFIKRRPTFLCSHWLQIVYTQDATMTSFLPPAYVVRREGNVLTCVCPSINLSVHRGVPISHNALQHFPECHGADTRGGTLPGPAGGGTLPGPAGGVPCWGGYPARSSQGGTLPGGYPAGGYPAWGVPWSGTPRPGQDGGYPVLGGTLPGGTLLGVPCGGVPK